MAYLWRGLSVAYLSQAQPIISMSVRSGTGKVYMIRNGTVLYYDLDGTASDVTSLPLKLSVLTNAAGGATPTSVFAHAAGGLVVSTDSSVFYYASTTADAERVASGVGIVEVAAAGNRVWWRTRSGSIGQALHAMGCVAGYIASGGGCMQVLCGYTTLSIRIRIVCIE